MTRLRRFPYAFPPPGLCIGTSTRPGLDREAGAPHGVFPIPLVRVLIVLLALAGVLPAAPLAVGAKEDGCEHLPSRDAAQTFYETDPTRWADALDPDGNGRACDQRTALHDQDGVAYLEAVVDHTAALNAGLDPLLDVVQATDQSAVSTQDRVAFDGIVARFAQAPAVAASLAMPAGYASLQAVYVKAAAAYADVADVVMAWSETRPGTPDNAIAREDLTERVGRVTMLSNDLGSLLHAQGL